MLGFSKAAAGRRSTRHSPLIFHWRISSPLLVPGTAVASRMPQRTRRGRPAPQQRLLLSRRLLRALPASSALVSPLDADSSSGFRSSLPMAPFSLFLSTFGSGVVADHRWTQCSPPSPRRHECFEGAWHQPLHSAGHSVGVQQSSRRPLAVGLLPAATHRTSTACAARARPTTADDANASASAPPTSALYSLASNGSFKQVPLQLSKHRLHCLCSRRRAAFGVRQCYKHLFGTPLGAFFLCWPGPLSSSRDVSDAGAKPSDTAESARARLLPLYFLLRCLFLPPPQLAGAAFWLLCHSGAALLAVQNQPFRPVMLPAP